MTSNAESGRTSGTGSVGVSGPTSSLWLKLLRLSALSAAAGLLAIAVLAAVVDAGPGMVSTILGGVLVMLFFGVSLLVGHVVGRRNPSGAIGLFVATYFVKVVGFAVVLFVIGRPEWLHARWFLIGAVATVVLWQAAELYGFSKARLQIFNDPTSEQRSNNA